MVIKEKAFTLYQMAYTIEIIWFNLIPYPLNNHSINTSNT